MHKSLWLSAALWAALWTTPTLARPELYRWLNPETGQYTTTPTLPPYPIKEKRPGANLPGVDFYNVDLDRDAPAVRAAIQKREVEKEKERRKGQEHAEQKARKEQAERERKQEESQYVARKLQEAAEIRKNDCTGPLSFGIKLGMTDEQVRACLLDINNGCPDHINTTTTATGQREQWVYRVGDKTWYLYFRDGRLTTIQQ